MIKLKIKKYKIILIFIVSLFTILFISTLFIPKKIDSINLIKTTNNQNFNFNDTFINNGVFYLTSQFEFSSKLKTYGSFTKFGDIQKGSIISPLYILEKNQNINIALCGYPNKCNLYIENIYNNLIEIININDNNIGEKWIEKSIKLKKGLFRIIAKDTSDLNASWVAFSEPYLYTKKFTLLTQMKLLVDDIFIFFNIIICYLYFILFLLIGILITYKFKNNLPQIVIKNIYIFILISFCLSLFVSYIILIFTYLNNYLGIYLSILIIILTIYYSFKLYVNDNKFKNIAINIQTIFLFKLIFLIGLVYLSSLLLTRNLSNFSVYEIDILFKNSFTNLIYNKCFFGIQTCDNILPLLFSNKIYNNEHLKPFIGDWLSSDRPPLFSAAINFLRPISIFRFDFFYQVFGTFLQLSWIIGLLAFSTYLNLKQNTIKLFLIIAFLSPIFLFNSLFLWPKLISITLYILLFILLNLYTKKNRNLFNNLNFTYIVFISWLVVALMLFHGGNVFSIIAIFLFFSIRLIKKITFKHIILLSSFIIILYLPWIYFQKIIDPIGGDRLLRWHLANDLIPFEISHLNLFESIKLFYSQFTMQSWFYFILNKLYIFFIPNFKLYFSHLTNHFFSMGSFGSAFFEFYISILIFIILLLIKKNSINKIIINNYIKFLVFILINILIHILIIAEPVLISCSFSFYFLPIILITLALQLLKSKILIYMFIMYNLFYFLAFALNKFDFNNLNLFYIIIFFIIFIYTLIDLKKTKIIY